MTDNKDLRKEMRIAPSGVEPWVLKGVRFFNGIDGKYFTDEKEDGWYRKFEKKNKRSNFK